MSMRPYVTYGYGFNAKSLWKMDIKKLKELSRKYFLDDKDMLADIEASEDLYELNDVETLQESGCGLADLFSLLMTEIYRIDISGYEDECDGYYVLYLPSFPWQYIDNKLTKEELTEYFIDLQRTLGIPEEDIQIPDYQQAITWG